MARRSGGTYDNEDGTWVQVVGNADGSAIGGGATSVFGTKSLTTTVAVALVANQACVGVYVENPETNSVDILVGDSSSQIIRLKPGDDATFRATNVSQIYAKNASSTTQTINWVAEVLA